MPLPSYASETSEIINYPPRSIATFFTPFEESVTRGPDSWRRKTRNREEYKARSFDLSGTIGGSETVAHVIAGDYAVYFKG